MYRPAKRSSMRWCAKTSAAARHWHFPSWELNPGLPNGGRKSKPLHYRCIDIQVSRCNNCVRPTVPRIVAPVREIVGRAPQALRLNRMPLWKADHRVIHVSSTCLSCCVSGEVWFERDVYREPRRSHLRIGRSVHIRRAEGGRRWASSPTRKHPLRVTDLARVIVPDGQPPT